MDYRDQIISAFATRGFRRFHGRRRVQLIGPEPPISGISAVLPGQGIATYSRVRAQRRKMYRGSTHPASGIADLTPSGWIRGISVATYPE